MTSRFLASDRFQTPQFIAGGMLLIYLLQSVWLLEVERVRGAGPDSDEALRIYLGVEQWKGGAIAGTPESLRAEEVSGLPSAGRGGKLRVRDGFDEDRSPLYYLVAGAPAVLGLERWLPVPLLALLKAGPSLFFGMMLGGSLWYVARRLYGNAGGYIALAFYCTSPAMIGGVAAAGNAGEMGGVWGAFGTVFTAIAVAHTLYAPREVVVWNWKRILLLGLSLALAVGDQFSLGVLVLVILPVMLWVVPVRPKAVFAIWITAAALAKVLLLTTYFFEFSLFWQGLRHAKWIDFQAAAFGTAIAYRYALRTLLIGSPAMTLALPVVLMVYAGWKRARYFGNSAPLVIAALMLTLGMAAPDFPGQGFYLTATVLLFVFVSGVFADLMESKQRDVATMGICILIATFAAWNVLELIRAGTR
jgi:hypothetical protein